MQKEKFKNFITAISFGGVLVVASMMAYFTGADTVTNRMKAASLDITLTETKWIQTDEPVMPDEVLEKNPQVTNNGEADAFVFLRVHVPYILNGEIDYNGDEILEDGTIAKKGQSRMAEDEPMPLFKFVVTKNGKDDYDKNLTSEQIVHDERWTLLEGYPYEDKKNRELVYVYAYTEQYLPSKLTTTKKGDSPTIPLFDKIKLVNYGGEFLGINVGGVLSVDIDALAIQTTELGENCTANNPLGVWNFLTKQYNESGVNS